MNSKNLLYLGVFGVLGYFIYKRVVAIKVNNSARAGITAITTGTQSTHAPWFPSWNGFNIAALQSTSDNIKKTWSSLVGLSNNLGKNDGGKAPGVSISGSNVSGQASSGSGVGVPANTDLANAPIDEATGLDPGNLDDDNWP